MKRTTLFMLFGLTHSASVFAQLTDSESLFDLPLAELLNVEVTVASTELEAIAQTPAIVSRYNRSDLEKMGITNLRDVFNFVPGVIVQHSITGMASVQIRGIDEAFNQKVLFLLDGIPYHQPSHSFIPIEGIPWESISHIEVIRGPGAVFHGTQASGGVFNVVTKKQAIINSLYTKVGTNNLTEASFFYATKIDDARFSIGGEVRREDKESITYRANFPDIGIIEDIIPRELERESLILRYTNNDFNAFGHIFSDKTVGINDAYTDENTLQPFIVQADAYLAHFDYTWHSKYGKTKVYTDYNHYTFDLNINNLFAPGVNALVNKDNGGKDDYRFRMGTEYNYTISNDLNFTLGIENETRSIGNYSLRLATDPKNELVRLIDRDKVDELSLYSQFDYTIENWRLLLGGRYTDNEISGDKITPRLGAVYSLSTAQSLKLLYSTGFNSPNPTQTSIFLPGNVIGNKNLSAETVEAFDIAYTYSEPNILFVANIYKMDAEDFIIRRFSEELESVSFYNAGYYTRKGAELDLQIIAESITSFINIAYQHDGNKVRVNDPDAFRIPKLTLNSGISYQLFTGHNIGANVSYIGERSNINGYSVVGLNYTGEFEHFDVTVNVNNLFNEAILNPNNTSQNSTLAAQGPEGTRLEFGVRFKF